MSGRKFTLRSVRWWIAALLATATALNYLDRQSLPVLVTEVRKSIPITDQDYSRLQMMFLLAYGVMYAAGGRLIDRLGTRTGYAVMIVWWSAANMLHGFVNSVAGLGIARFLLGLGEGGGFPGSAKAVSEWFPPKERAFAFGIFNTGSSLGAVIAPPLIAVIAMRLDWRWVFVITGALGFLWAAAWIKFYRLPANHEYITPRERSYLEAKLESAQQAPAQTRWVEVLRYRQIWGLMAAKFLSDSAWFFFIFWLPKYLADARGLDIRQIGYYAWIPYAFAGLGSFCGGWLSSFLIRRNFTVDRSRKLALGISAALMPVSLLIAAAPLSLAIVFFSVAMLGHQFWSTIVQTLAADIFPSRMVGSAAGLMGAVGSFGAMLFNLLVGWILTEYGSYSPAFLISGVLHPISFFLILLIVRHIQPVQARRD